MERQLDSKASQLLVAAAIVAALALALALAATPAGAAYAPQATSPAPKSGAEYAGRTAQDERLRLTVAGRSVQIVGFSFDCRSAVGTTSVQDIRIRKTSRGRYVFSATAYGIVSFSDEQPDENAKLTINGRFSRSARSVTGRLRVDAPRCDTRSVTWSARLRRAQ